MPARPVHPRRHNLHHRRHYSLGAAGIGHILFTLLVAVGAYNSQNNLLFWAFGFALGLLIVSGVLSGVMLMGLEVARERVPDARAGTHLVIRYRLTNAHRLLPPAFALTIREVGHSGLSRSWLDRLLARPVSSPSPISPPVAFVAHVAAGQTAFAGAQVLAERRGLGRLSTIQVSSGFPFGLMVKVLEFDQPDEFVITPRPAPVPSRSRAGAPFSFSTGSVSPRSGAGDEFFALRDYRPGDPPSQVAWRPSARAGSLLVRQLIAPAPRRVWIVLLLRPEHGHAHPNTIERALSLAAGAIDAGVRAGLAIGLSIPDHDLVVPARTGESHAHALARLLGSLDVSPAAPGTSRAPFPARIIDRSSQLVVVTVDPGAPIPADLRIRALVLVADGSQSALRAPPPSAIRRSSSP